MQIRGTICGYDEPSVIEVKEGLIAAVTPQGGRLPARPEALGGADCLIAPALLDIQVNGFAGHDLNGSAVTAEDVSALTRALHQAGTGLYCATVVTGPRERMLRSLRAIAEACQEPDAAAAVVGIHLEGPYISAEDGPRGAHPAEHVRDPDWDEFLMFQDAAGGRIRIVTLAPERAGAIRFIERLARAGIVPALGHTSADAGTIQAAVRAGAKLSTHLGNGAHAVLPRHPNYIWEQLATDELWASIVPDGHHLPPSVVKCFVRCKGPERTILVSDAVHWAGLPPGEYRHEGRAVELTPEGRIQLKGTPYLAGSALELRRGVGNAVRFAQVPLSQALDMASLNPAKLLGVAGRLGTVAAGKEASLLVFRWDEREWEVRAQHVMVRGELVYSAP